MVTTSGASAIATLYVIAVVNCDALDLNLLWVTAGCGLHKSKVQTENFCAKTSFYRFWAGTCPLILVNPIVNFVDPTNQNAGFMINVQFLNKVGWGLSTKIKGIDQLSTYVAAAHAETQDISS